MNEYKHYTKTELINEIKFLENMLENYKKMMGTYKFWYEYYARETDTLRNLLGGKEDESSN